MVYVSEAMRGDAAVREWLSARRGLTLACIGVAMLVAGYIARKDLLATALILSGAGLTAVGILLPRLAEFEIGPGGVRTRLIPSPDGDNTAVAPAPEQLHVFALLVSGSRETAEELSKQALTAAKTRTANARESDVRSLALRNLIDLLETDSERRWLHGLPERPSTARAEGRFNPVAIDALARLEMPARAAYVMRVEWLLRPDEIAALLQRAPDLVEQDLAEARELLLPQLDDRSAETIQDEVTGGASAPLTPSVDRSAAAPVTQRFPRYLRVLAALGATVAIGVTALVGKALLDPGFSPLDVRSVSLEETDYVSDGSYGSYLREVGRPASEVPAKRLRERGHVFRLDVQARGYADERLSLHTSLVDARALQVVSFSNDPPPTTFVPEADTYRRVLQIWVPEPAQEGRYFYEFTVHDPQGRPLAVNSSQPIEVIRP